MTISIDRAQQLDASDSLAPFRDRFYPLPDQRIYMDGNSLGLMSVDSEAAVLDYSRRMEGAGYRWVARRRSRLVYARGETRRHDGTACRRSARRSRGHRHDDGQSA